MDKIKLKDKEREEKINPVDLVNPVKKNQTGFTGWTG